MSYHLTLPCGCVVHVSCHAQTRLARSRTLQARAHACPVPRHVVGRRIYLWDLLPQPAMAASAEWADGGSIQWSA